MNGASTWVRSSPSTAGSAAERAAEAMQAGYSAAKAFGSATAMIAALDPTTAHLGVANLGDSGLRQVRHHRTDESDGLATRIVGRTLVQQHSFNCPFQLSKLPGPDDFDRLVDE